MTHQYLYFMSLLAAHTLIVALCLIAGMRLLGKRQTGQANIYDLALIMALANAVQNAMTTGKGNFSVGIVCAVTLLLIGKGVNILFVRWPKLEQHVVGMPVVLISNGVLDRVHMKRERVTKEDLMRALRENGLCDPSEVKLAILEVDGSLSIAPAHTPAADPANATKSDETVQELTTPEPQALNGLDVSQRPQPSTAPHPKE